MISGVYKLEFSSGAFYIGKSIDIMLRWKQHTDKLKSGRAAKLMQAEYDLCGLPDGIILKECHADHIDILESCLINRLRPSLNGTYPSDPLADLSEEEFDYFLDNIDYSTTDHLGALRRFEKDSADFTLEITELKEMLEEAQRTRSLTEINFEKDTRIKELERIIEIKDNILNMHSEELTYLRLPWYKRWFN